jgi:hypothetical protein
MAALLIFNEKSTAYVTLLLCRLFYDAVTIWTGHVARMGEKRNAYKILVGKPEGKRPLGRSRCKWEDDIKMDLRE